MFSIVLNCSFWWLVLLCHLLLIIGSWSWDSVFKIQCWWHSCFWLQQFTCVRLSLATFPDCPSSQRIFQGLQAVIYSVQALVNCTLMLCSVIALGLEFSDQQMIASLCNYCRIFQVCNFLYTLSSVLTVPSLDRVLTHCQENCMDNAFNFFFFMTKWLTEIVIVHSTKI